MTKIYVKVRPGSPEFKIENQHIPIIHLENQPENGRANHELTNRLEQILDVKPGIISGHKSRRKKLQIPLPEQKIREKLKNPV